MKSRRVADGGRRPVEDAEIPRPVHELMRRIHLTVSHDRERRANTRHRRATRPTVHADFGATSNSATTRAMSSRLRCLTSAGESSSMPEVRTIAGSTRVELGEEIAEGLRIFVGLDIEMPLRLTLLIDRQVQVYRAAAG